MCWPSRPAGTIDPGMIAAIVILDADPAEKHRGAGQFGACPLPTSEKRFSEKGQSQNRQSYERKIVGLWLGSCVSRQWREPRARLRVTAVAREIRRACAETVSSCLVY